MAERGLESFRSNLRSKREEVGKAQRTGGMVKGITGGLNNLIGMLAEERKNDKDFVKKLLLSGGKEVAGGTEGAITVGRGKNLQHIQPATVAEVSPIDKELNDFAQKGFTVVEEKKPGDYEFGGKILRPPVSTEMAPDDKIYLDGVVSGKIAPATEKTPGAFQIGSHFATQSVGKDKNVSEADKKREDNKQKLLGSLDVGKFWDADKLESTNIMKTQEVISGLVSSGYGEDFLNDPEVAEKVSMYPTEEDLTAWKGKVPKREGKLSSWVEEWIELIKGTMKKGYPTVDEARQAILSQIKG